MFHLDFPERRGFHGISFTTPPFGGPKLVFLVARKIQAIDYTSLNLNFVSAFFVGELGSCTYVDGQHL